MSNYMRYMIGGEGDETDTSPEQPTETTESTGKSLSDKFNACVSLDTWKLIYLVLAGVLIFITFMSRELDQNKKFDGIMPILVFWIHLTLLAGTMFVVSTKKLSSNLSMILLVASFLWSQILIIKQTDPVYLYTLASENASTPTPSTNPNTPTGVPVSQQLGGAVGLGAANLAYGAGSLVGTGLGSVAGYFDGIMGRSSKSFMYLVGMTLLNVVMLISGMNAFPCGDATTA